jgi:hypothetical protein
LQTDSQPPGQLTKFDRKNNKNCNNSDALCTFSDYFLVSVYCHPLFYANKKSFIIHDLNGR